MTIEQKKEAFELYRNYVEHMGKEPPVEEFSEFFWLFWKREDELLPCFKDQMSRHERFDETLNNFKNSLPEFNGFEEFINAAKKSKED